MTMLLLATALAADLDGVDAWAEGLESAARGPAGCFDVRADATWDHSQGQDYTRGSGTLFGRFEDHGFTELRLEDVRQQVRWRGTPIDRPLTLQLRPWLGQTGSWVLHQDGQQLFVRDNLDDQDFGARDVASGAIWVEDDGDHGILVRHAQPLRDGIGAPEQLREAWFDGAPDRPTHLSQTREPHSLRRRSARTESDWTLTWRYGLPATERGEVRWDTSGEAPTTYRHALDWTSFTPCVAAGDPIEPWTSGSDNPYLDALRDPTIANRDQLRWQQQVHRKTARNGAAMMGVSLAMSGIFVGIAASAPDPARRDVHLALAGAELGLAAYGGGLLAVHAHKARTATKALN